MSIRFSSTAAVGTAIGVFLACQWAGAQQTPGKQGNSQQREQAQQSQHKVCLASAITGLSVKDASDQAVGEIQDLVIDASGQVRYLAVATTQPGTTQNPNQREAGAPIRQRLRELRENNRNEQGEQNEDGRQDNGQQQTDQNAQEQTPAQRLRAARQRLQQESAQGAGKLTLIPFEAASFHMGDQPNQSYVSVDLDRERLMQAPSFTHQQLMSPSGSTQWMAQVDQFFGGQRRGAARPELDQNRANQQDRGQRPKQDRDE